jgi:hypothetical protein
MPISAHPATRATRSRPRCPKCNGQLYLEYDAGTRFELPPEWACLQCGWRRHYSPRQFERVFAMSTQVPAGEAAGALLP